MKLIPALVAVCITGAPHFELCAPAMARSAAGPSRVATAHTGQPLSTVAAHAWRDDRIWYDGLAEKCVYEASRVIYGAPRTYLATAYTNKETVDPKTTVKSDASDGILVFKHHWSERAPTENYDYDFSTMTYTRCDDLSAFKLTAAAQEDCGASFKEAWRDGSSLRWLESVYFPGGGRREGKLSLAPNLAFADALTLTLRDFPFDAPREMQLLVVPSQRDTRSVSFEPLERTVRYAGKTDLDLPIGRVSAHALELLASDGAVEARFWFAADGSAPTLHVLVQYIGADGLTFRLKSRERTAYWKRPG